MARGSLGRERMMSGVVGITAHQPPATGHQEDLNNELLAVSVVPLSIANLFHAIDYEFPTRFASVFKTPANCRCCD
jgi:hypothetical protein